MPSLRQGPTLAVQADVHHPMLDLHVPAEVALQVELAGAVGTLEGLAAGVQVHVPQQVVHAVEGLAADLPAASPQSAPRAAKGSAVQTWPPGSPVAPTKSNGAAALWESRVAPAKNNRAPSLLPLCVGGLGMQC